jgi:hypothetical protein
VAALVFVAGSVLVLGIVWEAFEAIVLPRRVTRKVRLTRLFYRATWRLWSGLIGRLLSGKRRETFLAVYGPISLLILLSVWAGGLVAGFALLHAGVGSHLQSGNDPVTFATNLYMSASTFFTLGLGDVVPRTASARVLTVIEAGMGFGFLALVIGYLPVIYQAFSRREVSTVLLDARAGSPPTATEMLRREGPESPGTLQELLKDWERWSADVLESHISYPVLCFYRSQHNNQSWLAALTAVLDSSALVMAGVEKIAPHQAALTFAIARHTVVDLAQILSTPPRPPVEDRLPPADLVRIRGLLAAAGIVLTPDAARGDRLFELRRTYEPYVNALSEYLMMPLPPWLAKKGGADNWQTSAWERISTGAPETVHTAILDEHA